MNVLITDGANRAALAIARSLGEKGHTVYVGEKKQPSLAASSKFCSGHFEYPDPFRSSEGFLEMILDIVKEKNIDTIFPVSDITTMLLSENWKRFEGSCSRPFSSIREINIAANKYEIFKLAEKLEVPIPNTRYLEDLSQMDAIADDMAFPIVIKPHKSRIRKNDGSWISTIVSYANDQTELRRILEEKDGREYPLLLQERIHGPGMGVFVCYNHGKLVGLFSHRRLREKPPSGGVSVLRESVPVPPMAREYTERLLSSLNWHGVAMVEFKLDQRDNIPKLMEINGRFWGSLQLAIDAGVDFPSILLDTIQDKAVKPILTYKYGVKSRWLWGEIDVLLMLLFKSNGELKLPPGYNGRLWSFIKFLKFWEKNMRYEVFSLKDFAPWLHESQNWFKKDQDNN